MTNSENTPTLRDQFAMAVATRLVAASEIHLGHRDSDNPMERHFYADSVALIAKTAYDIAEAMLEEREK